MQLLEADVINQNSLYIYIYIYIKWYLIFDISISILSLIE